jgi:hypothetical protein
MFYCYKDYTTVNSQPSIEALENLMSKFFDTFGMTYNIDDLFYYGVFCKPQTYTNYHFDTSDDYDFDIPDVLTAICSNYDEKLNYVNHIIEQVMKKEIVKPEWMKYIELNMNCNEFEQAPSTFLQIIPKQPQYEKLAQGLIDFLYSPNLLITMLKQPKS